MLNNSLLFWLFFLVVYLAYWFVVSSARGRLRVLLLASAVFYASWDVRLLWVPLLLTAITHAGARAIRRADEPTAEKRAVGLYVVLALLPLVGFRYTGFFGQTFVDL